MKNNKKKKIEEEKYNNNILMRDNKKIFKPVIEKKVDDSKRWEHFGGKPPFSYLKEKKENDIDSNITEKLSYNKSNKIYVVNNYINTNNSSNYNINNNYNNINYLNVFYDEIP